MTRCRISCWEWSSKTVWMKHKTCFTLVTTDIQVLFSPTAQMTTNYYYINIKHIYTSDITLQYMNLCSECSLQVKINSHILSLVVLVMWVYIMSISVPFLCSFTWDILNIWFMTAAKCRTNYREDSSAGPLQYQDLPCRTLYKC